MKFRTVWGVLPAFIKSSTPNGPKYAAKVIGPFVFMPNMVSSNTTEVALFRVKQNYLAFIGYFLTLLTVSHIFGLIMEPEGVTDLVGLYQCLTVLILAIVGQIVWNTRWMFMRRETAAIGETLRNMPKSHVNTAAGLYARSLAGAKRFGLKQTEGELLQKIAKRYEDRRLF